jgi:formate hydrogenlyase subunit 3/multisubunit Na+/H+ antiporter MnhD subunit
VSVIGVALAVTAGAAVLGAAAAVLIGRWGRAAFVGLATAASGVAGAIAGVAAANGQAWSLHVPDVLPLTGIDLTVDPLSGWFLVLIGVVTTIAGIYTIGYAGRTGQGVGSRGAMLLLPLFAASMMLVPIAATVPALLAGWELMAVTSLLLVLTEHRHQEAVRSAAVWYAVLTQLGFVALLVGTVWLSSAAGGSSFEAIRAAAPGLNGAATGTIFVLCVIGFAGKAGAVPLHPWLPRAHAESPSHVSTLMSAGMVKLGIYGILRFGFDLLGGGAAWWWLLVAVLGGLSALYGITQAAVARDIKQMLAFSTSENVGLILLGIGFAGLYGLAGNPLAAGLALTAALLHAANHAAFKALLFTGAGSVVRATGTRDLDKLGGLVRAMPATTVLFAAGALAAAALPPGNGFVSEWLLLQSLVHPGANAGTTLTIAAPLAVAVVALTAGIGVAAFVKALGTGFLARPRSDAASAARESPVTMVAAMGLAALACAVLAIVPTQTMPAVSRIAANLDLVGAPVSRELLTVRVAQATGGAALATIWPLWIAVAVVGLALLIAAMARLLGRPRRRTIAWDCGDGPLTARMEYTATSFAEPLQRVFDDVIAPERSLDVTHVDESEYHVAAVSYRQKIPDRIENRLYRPILAAARDIGERARALGNGSVHRYLGYMLTALLLVLIAGVVR